MKKLILALGLIGACVALNSCGSTGSSADVEQTVVGPTSELTGAKK